MGHITMFEAFRYRIGKNMALLALGKSSGYSPKRIAFMRRASGNAANQNYGKEALRQGHVANKYVAAAAVFARLANSAESFQATDITSENWVDAGFVALQLAKCPDEAIGRTFQQLLEVTR